MSLDIWRVVISSDMGLVSYARAVRSQSSYLLAIQRPLSALTSTTARYEKAGFAKPVDASATTGANLTLARWKKNVGISRTRFSN
jgi:hypothetical protein